MKNNKLGFSLGIERKKVVEGSRRTLGSEVMVSLNPVLVQPIGIVRNSLGRRSFSEWEDTESKIVISEEYKEALYRLDEFSHVEVLFHLHEMDRDFRSRIHPTGNPDYPLMGALATRTPNRPSRIALTTCRLLSIEGNVLRVKGLDAYDGSPVLDLKPHKGKTIEDIRIPYWLKKLKNENVE
jgi:tRNA-Thr(GGU) m(6)t(6)A37 methyltransferase TsaA